MRSFTRSALVAAITLTLAGCGSSGSSKTEAASGPEALQVIGEVYPLAWIAGQVGGDRVEVSQIVPAGSGHGHGFEISPAEVDRLGRASLVVYVSTLAPSVDEAIASTKPVAIDVAAVLATRPAVAHAHDHDHEAEAADHDHDHEAEAADHDHDHEAEAADHDHDHEAEAADHDHDHEAEAADHDHDHDHEAEAADHKAKAGGIDPHLWLDLAAMPTLVDRVAEELASIDPERKSTYKANAAALNDKLHKLDEEYRTGLASCKEQTVIVTHPAFGYLTDRYGLTQIGVSGIEEDTEPSPARLAEIAKVAEEKGASTFFFANSSNPKIADVLAEELHVKTQTLSTLTAPGDGEDYLTLVEQNLKALRDGLQCS